MPACARHDGWMRGDHHPLIPNTSVPPRRIWAKTDRRYRHQHGPYQAERGKLAALAVHPIGRRSLPRHLRPWARQQHGIASSLLGSGR